MTLPVICAILKAARLGTRTGPYRFGSILIRASRWVPRGTPPYQLGPDEWVISADDFVEACSDG